MECYSAIKRNEIMPFAVTGMDLEIVILSEESQTKTNTSLICGIKKKKSNANELTCKTEIVTDVENKLMVTKEEMKGEG